MTTTAKSVETKTAVLGPTDHYEKKDLRDLGIPTEPDAGPRTGVTMTMSVEPAPTMSVVKALTSEEKAALWADLDEAQETLEEAKKEVASLEEAVSKACTAIVAATGKTGFTRKGERIKFAKRKNSDVYFVRQQREDLEEVDV